MPESPIIRTHSMCYTGDIFHALNCDCREELENALNLIKKEGGLLIYPEEEGRGIGILNKIKAINSQHNGYDTVDANYVNNHPNDLRSFDYLKDVLEHYNIEKARVITNNPQKILSFESAGIIVDEVVKIKSTVNEYNRRYLTAKMNKNGHNFKEELSE